MARADAAPPPGRGALLLAVPRRRARLARALREAGYAVDEVGLAWAASRLGGGAAYDALVVDARPSEHAQGGLELVRSLRAEGVRAPILLLGCGPSAERVAGLEAGADDSLGEPLHLEELLARLRALLRRFLAPPLARLGQGVLRVDRSAHRVDLAGQPVQLTGRELAVLEVLASRAGEWVQSRELLAQVWGPGRPGLVADYVLRLRRKLGPRSIESRRGRGYRLAGEGPP